MKLKLWAKNEKSTRNCFYAKVVGGRVHCAKRHKFMTIDGGLSVVNVIGHKKLFYPCWKCPDLDIDWDEKKKDDKSKLKAGRGVGKCITTPETPDF